MSLINFLADVTCGSTTIPDQIVDIIHLIYNGIRIGVPIILIIVGMIDMGKAITQQKEDEIKKAQTLLVKKAIAAALVFLMFSLVMLLLSVVGGDDNNNCIKCLLTECNNTASRSINNCSEDQVYDNNLGRCVAKCGANQEYDFNLGRCVPK